MGKLTASWVFCGIFIASSFLIIQINGAKRLKCFNCVHVEGQSFHDFEAISEDSCKDGERTRRKLRVNCYDNLPNHDDKRGQIVGLLGDMQGNLKNKTRLIPVFTCAKFTFKGKFRGYPLQATIRTCIPSDRHIDSFWEACHEGSSQAVIEKGEKEVGQFVSNFSTLLGPHFETKACTCHEDNCNFTARLANSYAITLLFGITAIIFGYI